MYSSFDTQFHPEELDIYEDDFDLVFEELDEGVSYCPRDTFFLRKRRNSYDG